MDSTSPHYTVLARRFRPQTFEEVVGQEHVGQALRNAIRGGRVAHAYLFTGARGVGKTSTARIFAKALNCPHAVDGVPCNQCEVCRHIGAGTDVDVLEIDGASNRGIDDIRQLRANVNVRSMRSPYKVYIIDEVHMLTKEAFNALLKTLEEPPPNVKFVFCTTEPNKVPETILSRCQRFDFGTIASESIAGRLRQIAEAEGRQVDEEALELVARRAAGSMRDSQSLFDQLLAFGGDHVTSADVHRLLGTAPDERVVALVDHLIERRHAEALSQLEDALQEGVQLGIYSDQLLGYFRDLIVVAVGADRIPLSSVAERLRPQLQQQAQRWGIESATAAMQILSEAKSRMQRVNYARALFELALVRIGQLEQLSDLSALIQELAAQGGGDAPRRVMQPSPSRLTPSTGTVQQLERQTNSVAGEPGRGGGVAPVADAAPGSSPQVEEVREVTKPLDRWDLNDLWRRLLSVLPETLASHLKNTCKRAISGPNDLELVFPRSYLFSKSYCERPEAVGRMRDGLAQLVSGSVTVRFLVDESSQVSPPKTADDPVASRPVTRRTSVVDHDPFVQAAVAVFGGQVVEVRAGEPLRTSTSEDD